MTDWVNQPSAIFEMKDGIPCVVPAKSIIYPKPPARKVVKMAKLSDMEFLLWEDGSVSIEFEYYDMYITKDIEPEDVVKVKELFNAAL